MHNKFDTLKERGVLYYTELVLFPLFFLNNHPLIVEMMFIRGVGLSNASLLDLFLSPFYYDGSVTYADRHRFKCCQRSKHTKANDPWLLL